MPRECKRLAEVDFPIAVVSKHAAREKSIRHGHPSTLHLWWARRPLASSRAILLALLLPDPCDAHCPEAFKLRAREILSAVRQPPQNDAELRKALLWFVGAFANWDMAAHATYLQVGRRLLQAAHDDDAPLVLDPDGATPIAYLWARTVRCDAPNCGAEIPLMRSFWLCKKTTRKRALRYRVQRSGGETPGVAFDVFEPTADKEVPNGTVTRARATCLCCGSVLPPARVRAQLASERGGADVVFNEAGQRVGGARLTAVVTRRAGVSGRHYRPATQADYAAVREAQDWMAQVRADWERGGKQRPCPVPDEPLPPIGTLGFRVQRYGMVQWGDLFTARQKAALHQLLRLTFRSDSGRSSSALALALSRSANAGCSLCRWHTTRENHEGVYSRQALPIVWDFSEGNPLSGSTGGYSGALDWVSRVVDGSSGSLQQGQVQAADATNHPLPDETAGVWFTDPPYYDAIPYSDLSDYFLVWLKRALPDQPLLRDPFDPDNPLSPKTAEAVQDEAKRVDGRPKDREWFEETMARAFAEGRRVLRQDGVGSVVFAHKTTEGWEALLSGMIRGGWTITASWPIATEMGSRLRARDSAALATSIHLVCRPRPDDAPVGDWANVLQELPVRVAGWMERLQGEGIRGADLVFACIGPALEIFSRHSTVETADGRPVGLAEYLEKVWEVVGRTALESVLGAAEAKARNGLAGALEEDARLTALFLWTVQATTADGTRAAGAQEVDSPADDIGEDEDTSLGKATGFSLVFDVVRRFAQPLGIDLPKWERRTIETKKGVVRLLPVTERAKQLFGEHGSQAVAAWLEQEAGAGADPLQGVLFPEQPPGAAAAVRERPPRYGDDDRSASGPGATTLDRVHTGMLLQAGGRTNALRALVHAEQERGPDFLRLANALSALYPRGSDEKRLLDAMLLAIPTR